MRPEFEIDSASNAAITLRQQVDSPKMRFDNDRRGALSRDEAAREGARDESQPEGVVAHLTRHAYWRWGLIL